MKVPSMNPVHLVNRIKNLSLQTDEKALNPLLTQDRDPVLVAFCKSVRVSRGLRELREFLTN